MPLTPDFHFSQNNLQDYIDCQRRFELRYILRLKWPAPQSEPVLEQERHMQLGDRFHALINQYVTGLPVETLTNTIADPELSVWWQSFLSADPLANLPTKRNAEIALTIPFQGFRLLAQFDLVAIEPGGKAIILDWKTSTRKTSRNVQKNRLQTRLYPFLLVEAGSHLNGGLKIDAAQVEMVYWYANFPAAPERFTYSQDQHQENSAFFTSLIQEIQTRPEGGFPLTPDIKKCLYCNYRSFCNRGDHAGAWDEYENEPNTTSDDLSDLDFGQIGEIAF